MSYASAHATLELSAREHTWRGADGVICSSVDLGGLNIVLTSAADARAIAARCLKAAQDIEAMAAEGAAAKEEA